MSVLEYQGATAATAVIMSYAMRSKKIIFVEGVSDGRILDSLFDDNIMPISAKGTMGVINALDLVVSHNASGNNYVDAIGFVDRDYLTLRDTNKILNRSDIVTTCYRDIEIDLFHTGCTRRLLQEKGSSGKWNGESDVISRILESLSKLSLLRAYNAVNEKSWNFQCIDLCKYVDTFGVVDEVKLISNFKQKNRITVSEWGEFESWVSNMNVCLKSITRGHDVSCVFGQMLRKALGNRKMDETRWDVVEENLRLAVEKRFVEIFDWFNLILRWSCENRIQTTTVSSSA